jgi:hypothetical protein
MQLIEQVPNFTRLQEHASSFSWVKSIKAGKTQALIHVRSGIFLLCRLQMALAGKVDGMYLKIRYGHRKLKNPPID